MTTLKSTPAPGAEGWGRVAAAVLAAQLVLLPLPTVAANDAGTFRATGNEPGWTLELTAAGIYFWTMEGETVRIAPTPQPETKDDAKVYRGMTDGQAFSVTITDHICADTMSGMPHPKTVAIERGGNRLSGCGGDPATLLEGEWRIEAIDGTAVAAKSEAAMAFQPDGKVNGNGSCNRFFGQYTLSGEGLKVSPLGSSMMACEQPLMEQEQRFLRALEAANRFEIRSDKRLVLQTGDGRTIVARRP